MKRRFFEVPQKDKQIFLSPSRDKISSPLEENKKIFSQYYFKILNQPFKEVRENSRKEIVQRALRFSSKFDANIEEKICSAPQYIIQSGHQPVFRYSFIPGYGLKTSSLEIPFSQICDSDEFLSFFLEIIKNIESFSEIYNNKLDGYRKLFKIRNRAHPSPNLMIKENLIETPFGKKETREEKFLF